MKIRYAITYLCEMDGLRHICHAARSDNMRDDPEKAKQWIEDTRQQHVDKKILTPTEGWSMEVREVCCYDHGDPIGALFGDEWGKLGTNRPAFSDHPAAKK